MRDDVNSEKPLFFWCQNMRMKARTFFINTLKNCPSVIKNVHTLLAPCAPQKIAAERNSQGPPLFLVTPHRVLQTTSENAQRIVILHHYLMDQKVGGELLEDKALVAVPELKL